MSPVSSYAINLKIRKLVSDCVDQGWTNDQIKVTFEQKILKPLYRRRYLINLLKLITITTSIMIIAHSGILNPLFSYVMRKVILMSPLDLQAIRQDKCILYNPYYIPTKSSFSQSSSCTICENVSNVTIDNYNQLLFDMRPIKMDIFHEIHEWLIYKITLEDLMEIYSAIDQNDICMFKSSVTALDPYIFLKKVTFSLPWFAHWENCGITSRKHLRKIYNRPSSIPSYIELTLANWLVISNNYSFKSWKSIYFESRARFSAFIQLRGTSRIKLSPNNICIEECDELYTTLEEGFMLMHQIDVWSLSYISTNETFNFGLIITGTYE